MRLAARPRRSPRVGPGLGVVLLSLLCGGCELGGGERHIRVAFGSKPYALDPHHSNESVAYSIYFNIYEALVRCEAGGPVVPVLALRWANPDDLGWEFTLVPDARFQDGSSVTSADVAFSLERARDDSRSAWRSALVDVVRIETPSASRLVLHTRRPLPTLLQSLADVAIVSKHHVQSGRDLEHEPLGTGPYRFVSWDDKRGLRLRRWDDYRGKQPAIAEVDFLEMADPGARVGALRTGSVDLIADLPAEALGHEGPGVRSLKVPSLRELFLAFDTARPRTPYASPARNPFRDRRVRLAMLQAIDTSRIGREILGEAGEEATQLVSPRVFGYDPGYKKPGFDVAASRQLLRLAGLADGFSVSLDAPRGAYPADLAIADFVADSLQAVGVRVTVNRLEKAALFEKLARGDTSFYMLSWGATSGDAQEVFDSLLHTRDTQRGYGSDNYGGFSDPVLDELAEEAAVKGSPTLRQQLLQRAVRQAMDAVPWVPIYVQTDLYGIRDPYHWDPQPDKRIRIQDISN